MCTRPLKKQARSSADGSMAHQFRIKRGLLAPTDNLDTSSSAIARFRHLLANTDGIAGRHSIRLVLPVFRRSAIRE